MKNIFWNKYTILGIVLIIFSLTVNANAEAIKLTGNFNLEGDCFAPALTEFSLKNDSVEKKNYTITAIDAYREWINLNGKWIGKENGELKFSLNSEETKTFYAFVKPPCNTEAGNYTIALKTTSGKEEAMDVINFNALDARKVELLIDFDWITVGQCEPADYDLNITNNSKADEVIQVLVEGLPEKWVTSIEEFLLKKEQSIAKKIVVIPECNAKLQDYDFKVIARIKGTNFEDTKGALLTIEDAQLIEITAKDFTVCNDLVEEKAFKIMNNGIKDDKVKVALIDVNSAELSEKEFELKAGEEKTLKITFKEEKQLVGKDEFKIKVSSETFAKKTEETIAVNRENCYDLEVMVGPSSLVNITAGKEYVDKIKVKNTGTQANNAELLVEANKWISFVPQKATIESGEVKEFYFYVNPPLDLAEGKYEEKVTLKGDDFIQYKNVSVKVASPLKVEVSEGGVTVDTNLQNVEEDKMQKVSIKVKAVNDSNSNIFIEKIYAKDLNAEFNPEKFMVDKNSEKEIEMSLFLKNYNEAKLTIPLTLKTSDGTKIEKTITVDLQTETVTVLGLGLLPLSADTAMLAGGIVIAILAIITVTLYIRKGAKRKN